jgi:hypothetical protein
MEPPLEATAFFDSIRKSLSSKRFGGYGNDRDALAKYLWNTQLCESLYPCFQILEVAFRNRAHSEIGVAIKDANWISHEHPFIYDEDKDAIKYAKESLTDDGCPITEDYLVAEMKFGFWTTILNSKYETLWRKIISSVFPNMPNKVRTRSEASSLMNKIRWLRNAALHHHSIWHWEDLRARHKQMRDVIGFMCKPSADIADHIDRFPSVHAVGIGECQKIVSKILSAPNP